MSRVQPNHERDGGVYTSIPAAVRFWRLVKLDDPDRCWLWTGSDDGRRGYGHFYPTIKPKRHIAAHRYSFEFFYGVVTLCVLHRCDTPKCVNPNHLFLGTNRENTADRHRKGRSARGERSGQAKLTEAQAREVLTLRGTTTQLAVAERFGVARGTVGAIWRGKLWSWLSE